MQKIQKIADPEYVKTQYQNASNLNARIRLHELFSTNKYGWLRWLFDQYEFSAKSRVLELGCGAGNLWVENSDRIPEGLEIVLSDNSEGMLQDAQENLINHNNLFQFKKIDAQTIPFGDDSFEIVIANHMLYHVPDAKKAMSEIRRVLVPDGKLYASTIGEKHLKELKELLVRFDVEFSSWGWQATDLFTLENGSAQLGLHFSEIALRRYSDSLLVTDAGILIDYILSGRVTFDQEQRYRFASFVEREFEEKDGEFFITKDSGVFEASGDL